jgi:hypothetical protein
VFICLVGSSRALTIATFTLLSTKDHINGILKDRWYALTADDQEVWRDWEDWDAKRYEYQMEIFTNQRKKKKKSTNSPAADASASAEKEAVSIPKKVRKESSGEGGGFFIPKKRKQ